MKLFFRKFETWTRTLEPVCTDFVYSWPVLGNLEPYSGTWTLSPHWEELLQSVSDFIFSKHYGYRSRGLRGVKRSEKLWEIQNYPLPGRPFTHHWVKSKTICHFLRNFDAFLNGFWFYSILAGWSTWQWVFLNFSQNFWSFDTPDTPGCASAVI